MAQIMKVFMVMTVIVVVSYVVFRSKSDKRLRMSAIIGPLFIQKLRLRVTFGQDAETGQGQLILTGRPQVSGDVT